MAHCPFCKAPIEDELSRFGGHCPKCVIEIPGDETPTDPGVGKRAEQQVEEERKGGGRSWLGVVALAALVLVLCGGVLTWQVLRSQEAARLAALEAEADNGFYIQPETEHHLPTVEGAESPVSSQPSATRSNGSRAVTTIGGGGNGSSGPKRFDFIGNSDVDAPELAELHERKIDVAPGGADLGSVGFSAPQVSISRGSVEALALSDPEEIRESVGTALKRYSKQMNTCYERRLKMAAELSGTWEARFTIMQTGRTAGILVVPYGGSDNELEACMARAVASWTFQPMVEAQRIEKPYNFGTVE